MWIEPRQVLAQHSLTVCYSTFSDLLITLQNYWFEQMNLRDAKKCLTI